MQVLSDHSLSVVSAAHSYAFVRLDSGILTFSVGKDGVPDEEIEPRKVLMDQLKLVCLSTCSLHI